MVGFPEYKVTEGLDKLSDRLKEYKQQGVKFAKWRAVFPVIYTANNHVAIKTNSDLLARYAAICQDLDMVPIVEPEVLMDGGHTIEDCAAVSKQVFNEVFASLNNYKVVLEGMILQPNMVVSGINCKIQADVAEVSAKTLDVLRETVPAAVPAILFLSGGQPSKTATLNLSKINSAPQAMRPWYLSFSYGRALQEDTLKAWAGKNENITKAQQELYKRAKLNSLAVLGKYNAEME